MNRHIIGLDFETACEVDLRKHGLDRYVSHPSFRVLIASVHTPEGRIRFDFVRDPDAKVLLADALAGMDVAAHNAGFERAVCNHLKIEHHVNQWIDSAMIARAAGAASKLEAAAPQLLDIDKMEEGRDLIKLFSMPQEDGTFMVDHMDDWDAETWAKWWQFFEYCDLDAQLSYDIAYQYLRVLTAGELEFENITHLMNERGWLVDLDLVREMQQLYFENLNELEAEFRRNHDPDGKLNFRSTVQLRKWCAERKVRATSFDELHVRKLLERVNKEIQRIVDGGELKRNGPDLFQLEEVRDLLVTKQELGGSSLSKLQTILDMVGPDGRLRNQYLHGGAGQSMRTSGRGVQMQNLKRLGPEPDDVRQLFAADKHYHSEWDNGRLARNLRQVFKAQYSGELIVGDFSAVESRGLAFLAGEQWKLAAYREGKDLYKVLASSMIGTPYEQIDKAQRQQGKVGELSCGYGAGPGAVVTFAEKMGMDIDEAQATEIVYGWRDTNPQIVALWATLDEMLHEVVEHRRSDVWRSLANGRLRCGIVHIANPDSVDREFPGTRSILLILTTDTGYQLLRRTFIGCHMRGRDVQYLKPREQKSGQLWSARWTKNGQSGPYKIYGGKLTGILTQSFCRELFFMSLQRIESALQPVPNAQLIGQFHDEAVIEWWPQKNSGAKLLETKAIVEQAMTGEPMFPEFPLVADVKHGHRYIK